MAKIIDPDKLSGLTGGRSDAGRGSYDISFHDSSTSIPYEIYTQPADSVWEFKDSTNPAITPLDELVRNVLKACVVCGVEEEGSLVLCSLCQEAVREARNALIRGMIIDVDNVTGKKTERKPLATTYHCGFTRSGELQHAVMFLGGREYAVRAACGVRVSSTKRRLFHGTHDTSCRRCGDSVG